MAYTINKYANKETRKELLGLVPKGAILALFLNGGFCSANQDWIEGMRKQLLGK